MTAPAPVSASDRGRWASRMGFILAAAGSAVGLGNIWKFPYITGRNGGGIFVLIYLACVAVVALPIMVAEILVGRTTQRSPISAFRQLSGKGSPWVLLGWLGVIAGFGILSYYSVAAGWSMYYTYVSLTQGFSGMSAPHINEMFGALVGNPVLNTSMHGVFMLCTVALVIGGVQGGIERWSRILMPALFVMLIALVLYGMTLSGRGQAFDFMFGMHSDQLEPAGLLEAMGQAFFSLSLGMGALLTYGSYLPKDTSLLRSAVWVAVLDTAVALLASLMIFPVTFTYGMEPSAGPGLVFQSLPLAFSQMPAGRPLSIVFFSLLVFAALTSAMSLLEVVVSTLIDLGGWSRRSATLLTGAVTFVLGVPSALTSLPLFGSRFKQWAGRDFFDTMDNIATNWMLPLGGLLLAIYVGWALNAERRKEEFLRQTPAVLAAPWLGMLRVISPVAVALVMFRSTGLLRALGVPW